MDERLEENGRERNRETEERRVDERLQVADCLLVHVCGP
jgi:hypothetical protein